MSVPTNTDHVNFMARAATAVSYMEVLSELTDAHDKDRMQATEHYNAVMRDLALKFARDVAEITAQSRGALADATARAEIVHDDPYARQFQE